MCVYVCVFLCVSAYVYVCLFVCVCVVSKSSKTISSVPGKLVYRHWRLMPNSSGSLEIGCILIPMSREPPQKLVCTVPFRVFFLCMWLCVCVIVCRCSCLFIRVWMCGCVDVCVCVCFMFHRLHRIYDYVWSRTCWSKFPGAAWNLCLCVDVCVCERSRQTDTQRDRQTGRTDRIDRTDRRTCAHTYTQT